MQGFILRTDLQHIVIYPEPQDLENYYVSQVQNPEDIVGKVYKPETDTFIDSNSSPSKAARKYRNSLRDAIDVFLRPAATYKDVLISEQMRQDLIADSVALACWPKTNNWPDVALPELSPTFKELIGDVEWK